MLTLIHHAQKGSAGAMIMKTISICLIGSLVIGPVSMVWAQKAPASTCFVAQFKSLSLRTHDPELRANLVRAWLERNVTTCTDVQLATLLSNSPIWLGTALTLEITAILEGAIESKIAGNPALMGKLYESLSKDGPATSVTYTNPPPRAPVVRPMVNAGVIAGSPNFGSAPGLPPSNPNNNQNASPETDLRQNNNR